MVTLQLRISGKVQGVWYRASAKEAAISIGINGIVWNEPNGDVGAIVQGEQEQVDEFINWCWQGPPLSRVVNIQKEELVSEDIYASFEIARIR